MGRRGNSLKMPIMRPMPILIQFENKLINSGGFHCILPHRPCLRCTTQSHRVYNFVVTIAQRKSEICHCESTAIAEIVCRRRIKRNEPR